MLPLAQSSFIREGELWLKSLLCDFKYLFPSFRLPKSNLREVPHQSIKKFLHNFQSWEEQMWNPNFEVQNVTCCCNQFQYKSPGHWFAQGHVAAGLEEFRSFLPNSSSIALASAASTFFSGKNNWKTRSRALFDYCSNDIGFLTFCVVMSSGLLMFRLWRSLTDSLGPKSKRSKPSYITILFYTMRIIIPTIYVVCYCPQFYIRSILTT